MDEAPIDQPADDGYRLLLTVHLPIPVEVFCAVCSAIGVDWPTAYIRSGDGVALVFIPKGAT